MTNGLMLGKLVVPDWMPFSMKSSLVQLAALRAFTASRHNLPSSTAAGKVVPEDVWTIPSLKSLVSGSNAQLVKTRSTASAEPEKTMPTPVKRLRQLY